MSRYKILWIDDKWEELDSFKDRCELPKHGMEIIPCKYSVDGMILFEKYLEEWSGVILDAKVLYDKDDKVDKLTGLTYSLDKIRELRSKRYVPHYIFTGQPDLSSSSSFAEEHEGHYYEKDKDENRMIEDIKRNANSLVETQIIHKHQTVFDAWPESKHDLLRILKALNDEDWQNNSVLNDIRKIMSDVMTRLYECGFCTVEHNGSNLADCSRMIGQRYMEEIIPVYIQRAIHTCVEVTNPGSHRSKTDKDVAKGNAPYLIRSLIYNMLDILFWCRLLPPKEDRNDTLKAIIDAQKQYEQKRRNR